MISKEEREKDKAICNAATPPPWIHEGGRMFRCRPHGDSVSARTTMDALFMVAARERLPAYIAALDDIEERFAAAEEVIAAAHRTAAILAEDGDDSAASLWRDRAQYMNEILEILRGDT